MTERSPADISKSCGDCKCCGWEIRSSKKNISQLGTIKDAAVNTAAFLPDCVRYAIKEMKCNADTTIPFSVKFSAVFMACEIQAIPESIDLYSISNNYSAPDVMDELNFHIARILKKLIREGGDIMCIQNDTIECIWPSEDGELSLPRMVLNKALAIQKQHGATPTKVGSQLQNKIFITLGNVEVLIVGSENVHYVLAGDVLNKTRNSLSMCGSGEVVVTKAFWYNIKNKDKYRWKEISDNLVTVSTTLKNDDLANEEKFVIPEPSSSDIADEINKFLHPLCKSVKTEQQLQVLASLSNVVFISVRTLNLDLKELNLLHKAINDINEVVTEHQGIINKIIYRKDLIICIVLSLTGFKHSNKAVEGILCAQKILKITKTLDLRVVIGISCGVVFSGVLGSPHRQEFCVLGMPSHTSLSLVHQFEEEFEVGCDVNVFLRSCRFLGDIFSPISNRTKGMKYPGPFFEVHSVQTKKPTPSSKCVGKTDEKKLISKSLKELLENIAYLDESLALISITGKLGSGKSTLLNWSMEEGKRLGFRFTVRVENTAFEKSSDNAWSVVKQILATCLINSETKILETLGSNSDRFPLHLLNKNVNTNFSQPDDTSGNERNGMEMMVELVKQCTRGDVILIGVDNAEHTGTDSWLFLQCLLADQIAVVLATFTDEFSSSVPFIKYLIGHQYAGVKLGPVAGDELGALACHILRVGAIHKGFLKFLEERSSGNALHLQEILMLPPLQKHYVIIPFSKVPKKSLEEDFVYIDQLFEDSGHSDIKVCDIVDPEGLWSISVPKKITDLVMDHTRALSPEEQMLMKKCCLLGESFGLRILELVCPEYTTDEIYRKVQALMEKNILVPCCAHWTDSKVGSLRKMSVHDMPLEYCMHPICFASRFLKRCVFRSMAENQGERLNLYLADLLQDETNRKCDPCLRKADVKKSSHELLRKYKIPNIDFRLCHCLHLKTDILLQVEHHLGKANTSISKRIDLLLEAAETSLDVGDISKVEDIINKTKQLMNIQKEQNGDDYVRVAIERLRARTKIQLGNRNDALRCLKKALLIMHVEFPNDVKKRFYKSRKFKGRLGIEEYKCLSLGCFILTTLAFYEDAARVGCLLLKILRDVRVWLENSQESRELIDTQVLILKAVSKCEPAKSRERACYKLINQIRTECFKRMMENPMLEIEELQTIIRAFKTIVRYLFENLELETSKELGRLSVQLLKILNFPKQLSRILFWLANIFFSEENYVKCAEMLEHMQDAYQQSGDSLSQIIYYIMLTKLLRRYNASEEHKHLVELCSDFAIYGTDRIPQHPKHFNRTYCLCSKMALWCLQEDLEYPFITWYQLANKIKSNIYLDNYWSISGAIDLEIAKILKMQEKCFVFTRREVATFKETSIKSIDIIFKQAKKYVPVLERDVKVIEEHLQNAVKECKAFSI